jgi:uncharacterized SAM-binding protein YcdF (DUF218 family)
MPPVPFLVLTGLAANCLYRRRAGGLLLLAGSLTGVWLSTCSGTAMWLQDHVLRPPGALSSSDRARLARLAGESAVVGKPVAAIMVLGSGRERMSPEYGTSDLSAYSVARLRYGIWLSRQTGIPLGFTGGVGWAQKDGADEAPEADVAARIAAQQFGWHLTWTERTSADTRQNAEYSVRLLASQGIREVVVVTHAFHMPRAMRRFELAAAQVAQAYPGRPVLRVTAAPLGFWGTGEQTVLEWLPSAEGALNVRLALKESLGLLLGA